MFNEVVNFAKNEADFIMYFSYVAVHTNGTLNVSEHNVKNDTILFENCDVILKNTTTFLSNICYSVITMISLRVNLTYMVVMEHANITFINTTYIMHLSCSPLRGNDERSVQIVGKN